MHRFSEAIWSWYAQNKRDLPWRHFEGLDQEEIAYRVLVSEIMLQQTQVPRVTILFPKFLEIFPTIESLAAAGNRDVIVAWKGLGYNNRAIRLRDCARTIIGRHRGAFPRDEASLRALPGIGPYTAAAILNFAFDMPTPCADVNIERIYLRVFSAPGVTMTKDDMRTLTKAILEIAIDGSRGRTAREWHSALMDFGSLVCTKKNPRYDACPLMAQDLYLDPHRVTGAPKPKGEPSRGKIPNRIYRGRIVEALRSAPRGLTAASLGKSVCTDWSAREDRAWLEGILRGLVRDTLVSVKAGKYRLFK